MADQCIICLEDLDNANPEINTSTSLSDLTSTIGVDRSTGDSDLSIAVIKPCSHILHDSCLQTWTQKANSCPICRQNFNEVEVYDKVGGNLLSTYAVADKKQVADFDYLAWAENNPEDVESFPCPVCNETDQEDSLLICDGCDANYHTHCIGLNGIPSGDWFCMECVAAGAVNSANIFSPLPQDRRQRQQAQVRRARRARRVRASQWQGAWHHFTSRVWENTDIDLDFNEGDQVLMDFRRHEAQLDRERSRWQQRLRIASRQGARDSFRDATQPILHRVRELPLIEPQETAEEAASWRAMERAQELERPSGSRKRKSRSATTSANTSPAEPPAEPERKLKRPRTRRVVDTGATSDSAAESSRVRRTVPARRPEQQASSPSFLSSLLKEVESSPAPDNENRHLFDSTAIPYGDQSSRAVSPALSNHSTPRGMSTTPPPNSKRPSSPLPLTSHVMPAFPPSNYSPTRASPTSPADDYGHDPSSPSTELRMPRPRNRNHNVVQQRSDDLSPTRANMSLEAKEDINKIVKAALKTYWRPGGITKQQYMEVNKLVSRILYDRVALEDSMAEDEDLEEIAKKEVEKAVKGMTSVGVAG